jgi:hypothetical protein
MEEAERILEQNARPMRMFRNIRLHDLRALIETASLLTGNDLDDADSDDTARVRLEQCTNQ